MKWEYKSIQLAAGDSARAYKDPNTIIAAHEGILNKAGDDRWELIAVVDPGVMGPQKVLLGIFKRPTV